MKESDNDMFNNEHPTNPKIMKSEDKVSIPYILCAALWINDGKEYIHQVRNIDTGFIICGRRHHNCFQSAFILNGEKAVQKRVKEGLRVVQGFVTSDDLFVEREEAGVIAYNAGQTKKLKEVLFSEDLY